MVEKVPPFSLYSQVSMVVFVAVPVTTAVAGVVAPPPAGETSACVVVVKTIIGAGVPAGPVAP